MRVPAAVAAGLSEHEGLVAVADDAFCYASGHGFHHCCFHCHCLVDGCAMSVDVSPRLPSPLWAKGGQDGQVRRSRCLAEDQPR